MQLEIEVNVKRVGVQHRRVAGVSNAQGAAGLDLAANIATPLTIHPGARRPIPTGIAIQIPEPKHHGVGFCPQRSCRRAGINLANGVGGH